MKSTKTFDYNTNDKMIDTENNNYVNMDSEYHKTNSPETHKTRNYVESDIWKKMSVQQKKSNTADLVPNTIIINDDLENKSYPHSKKFYSSHSPSLKKSDDLQSEANIYMIGSSIKQIKSNSSNLRSYKASYVNQTGSLIAK